MQIIILGAGQVGGSLAASLAAEQHSITVVDHNEERLSELQNNFDLRTVTGPCSHPSILAQAGADTADMIIAVTDNDESNMVACQVAYALYNTPTKIARVRSRDYFIRREELFGSEHVAIDVFISPEQLVTQSIQRLIQFPGALQVLDFAAGRVKLVVAKPFYGGSLLGKSVTKTHEYLPNVAAQIVAVFRGDHAMPLEKSTVLEIGDEAFFLADSDQAHTVMNALRRMSATYKRIMIIGGGHIGSRLAQTLESHYHVKLIEQNRQHCQKLSQLLKHAIVLYGDGCDQNLLRNEDIENIDVFCALTNDDEDNIIGCLQAKRMGAKQVIALINRPAYIDLIEEGIININIAISPQHATVSAILTHIRRGDMVNVYSLRRGAAEAIEVIAHGDKSTSKVIGHPLGSIQMPKGTLIGAIVRGNEVIIPNDSTMIQPQDHVILFVSDKKHIPYVERLFQVSAGFF